MKTLNWKSALILAAVIVSLGVAQPPKISNVTMEGSVSMERILPGWVTSLSHVSKPEPRVINVTVGVDAISIEYARDYYPSVVPALYCDPPCDWTIHERWRDVYGVKDGRIVLLATIKGRYIPASSVPSKIIWEDDDGIK